MGVVFALPRLAQKAKLQRGGLHPEDGRRHDDPVLVVRAALEHGGLLLVNAGEARARAPERPMKVERPPAGALQCSPVGLAASWRQRPWPRPAHYLICGRETLPPRNGEGDRNEKNDDEKTISTKILPKCHSS